MHHVMQNMECIRGDTNIKYIAVFGIKKMSLYCHRFRKSLLRNTTIHTLLCIIIIIVS